MAQRLCTRQFLLGFYVKNLLPSTAHQSRASFVGILPGQTSVGLAARSRRLCQTREVAHARKRDTALTARKLNTIDAAEGGPNIMLVWRCLPPTACALLCVSEPVGVESRGLRSRLPFYSALIRPEARRTSSGCRAQPDHSDTNTGLQYPYQHH